MNEESKLPTGTEITLSAVNKLDKNALEEQVIKENLKLQIALIRKQVAETNQQTIFINLVTDSIMRASMDTPMQSKEGETQRRILESLVTDQLINLFKPKDRHLPDGKQEKPIDTTANEINDNPQNKENKERPAEELKVAPETPPVSVEGTQPPAGGSIQSQA